MIDSSSKNTLSFCLDFIKANFLEHSQTTMCKTWLKTIVDILDKNSEISSVGFIKSELSAIDGFLSGGSTSLTSNDIYSKIEMIETLLKDL